MTCTATDASGNSSNGSFTVLVADSPPTISDLPPSVELEATGPDGAIHTYTLPAVTDIVDPAPLVSCSPLSGSTFPLGSTLVTCTATDSAGNSSAAGFTVTVVDTTPPATVITGSVDGDIMSLGNGGWTLSQAISFTFMGTDSVGVAGFECSLDSAPRTSCAGSESFRRLSYGDHTFQVWATDTSGNADPLGASFAWTVHVAPSINTANLREHTVGEPYEVMLEANSGALPYTWTILPADGLPDGLTLNPATGEISGTPTTAVTETFTLRVTDKLEATGETVLTIIINERPTVTTTSLETRLKSPAVTR